jgi:hypothetical protein
MNKYIFMALVMSIASLFAVMLWAQAGRFEAKEAVYRAQADPSFTAPYRPMPLAPISH